MPCQGAPTSSLLGFLGTFKPKELFKILGMATGVAAYVSYNARQEKADASVTIGPPRAQSAPRSLRRALLMPQVHPGSLYRCGKID